MAIAVPHAYRSLAALGRAKHGRPRGPVTRLVAQVLLSSPNLSDGSYRLLEIVQHLRLCGGIRGNCRRRVSCLPVRP